MWKLLLIGAFASSIALAQTAPSAVDYANLREDVRGVSQRVGELALRLEQLERENGELRLKVSPADKNYVTLVQLNQAIEDLARNVRAEIATSKNETLQHVAAQIEKLAKQTNAALDSMAKSQVARPTSQAATPEESSKDGTTYTVQKGDSLAKIAKKTGVREQDIINANKIADPSHIVLGQILIIPNTPNSAAK